MIQSACAMTARAVRDDDDRLARVDEPVEQAEQLLDIGEMEAGGRLVEDEDASLSAIRVASLSRGCSPPDNVVSGWPMLT